MGRSATNQGEETPPKSSCEWQRDRGFIAFFVCLVTLTLAFAVPLWRLVQHALDEELHSHIVLIPFVSLYLAWLVRDKLPACARPSYLPGALLIVAAFTAFFLPLFTVGELSENDDLSRWSATYVLMTGALGFLCLGRARMRLLAFPFFFLVFMIPLPDMAVQALEQWLMRASATASHWLFQLTGTSVFRSGQSLQLPNITLQVARECSGIRSTWVLLITSLIAAYLFLERKHHRMIVVALVLPLGVVRNALRIVVIGLLCVHIGPDMIDSWIHHRGGPVFFAISLIPLFLVALILRWIEARSRKRKNRSDLDDRILQSSSL